MIRVVGIDPGLAGGLGVLDLEPGQGIVGVDMIRTPVEVVRRGKGTAREYDVARMREVLASLQDAAAARERPVLSALEFQGARPGQGVVSMFRTGLGFGLWWGLLVGLRVPFQVVTPGAWKRYQGLIGCDKKASRLRVQERFPRLGVVAAANEGPAEALLLAEYVAVMRLARGGWAGESRGDTGGVAVVDGARLGAPGAPRNRRPGRREAPVRVAERG
jgi:crossover junction endodeoxyribonuclease RuvC